MYAYHKGKIIPFETFSNVDSVSILLCSPLHLYQLEISYDYYLIFLTYTFYN